MKIEFGVLLLLRLKFAHVFPTNAASLQVNAFKGVGGSRGVSVMVSHFLTPWGEGWKSNKIVATKKW